MRERISFLRQRSSTQHQLNMEIGKLHLSGPIDRRSIVVNQSISCQSVLRLFSLIENHTNRSPSSWYIAMGVVERSVETSRADGNRRRNVLAGRRNTVIHAYESRNANNYLQYERQE